MADDYDEIVIVQNCYHEEMAKAKADPTLKPKT